mmetsp:Transcript_7544/g.23648  ORF Transcript_7544/g.23648 Transcript_7544/m.23648 type:complete len:318 (-) Transcript_7544:255-1208(-)
MCTSPARRTWRCWRAGARQRCCSTSTRTEPPPCPCTRAISWRRVCVGRPASTSPPQPRCSPRPSSAVPSTPATTWRAASSWRAAMSSTGRRFTRRWASGSARCWARPRRPPPRGGRGGGPSPRSCASSTCRTGPGAAAGSAARCSARSRRSAGCPSSRGRSTRLAQSTCRPSTGSLDYAPKGRTPSPCSGSGRRPRRGSRPHPYRRPRSGGRRRSARSCRRSMSARGCRRRTSRGRSRPRTSTAASSWRSTTGSTRSTCRPPPSRPLSPPRGGARSCRSGPPTRLPRSGLALGSVATFGAWKRRAKSTATSRGRSAR